MYTVAGCKCTWDANVHFSRAAPSKLYTHCRSTAIGPGPVSWVWPTSPVPRLTAGRPSWGGAAQGPEHGRTAPMAHPRCTMLAEVMLHDRDTLSHAEKSATVPISGWSGPAPLSLAKHVQPGSAHVQHSLAKVVADRGAT